MCIKYCFPNNANVSSVIPLDSGKSNKYDMIYEQVTKELIVLGTEKFLSPKISAYRKSYSTQHVLTSLIEEKLD